MQGKKTPRQTWVPIAIHRYKGDSIEYIHTVTGIAQSSLRVILKSPEYKAVEQRVWDALDIEQLNVHSLVQHAAKQSSAPTKPVEETPPAQPVDIPENVDTQM